MKSLTVRLTANARMLKRLTLFLLILPVGLADYLWNLKRTGKAASLVEQGKWLQRCARRHARHMGMTVHVHGPLPASGLLVSNHLSYLDILALSATTGCVFVAKSDVKRWPIFGQFAALAGTLFVQREKRGDVARVAEQMKTVLDSGAPLALFAEGTSSGGESVLPFRSSLLEPLAQQNLPVIATAVDYWIAEGSVADEICYWRDMTLAPHLLNVFRKERIVSMLAFAPAKTPNGHRKQIAQELQQEVQRLKTEINRRLNAPS